MSMTARARFCTLGTGLALLVSACAGDDPPLNAPSTLDPVTVVGVTVEGPARLAPGESAQYTALLNLSNFTTKSPASVKWIASPPSFLRVNAAGVATGGPFNGGAAVTAEVTQDGKVVAKSMSVIVLPLNTYQLVGAVTDAELGMPVVGARVELVTNTSISDITDQAGFYRLYGVPLSADIRITAPGYHTHAQNLDLPGDTRQDFRLALAGPRLSLSGNYRLTIEITSACSHSSALPQSLRLRQYDAVIAQNGLALQVELVEPRFLVIGGRGNRFSGSIQAAGASFNLRWDEDLNPDVVERLGDGTFLVTGGTVQVQGTAAGVSGFLNGSLAQFGPGFPTIFNSLGFCDIPRFTLTPR